MPQIFYTKIKRQRKISVFTVNIFLTGCHNRLVFNWNYVELSVHCNCCLVRTFLSSLHWWQCFVDSLESGDYAADTGTEQLRCLVAKQRHWNTGCCCWIQEAAGEHGVDIICEMLACKNLKNDIDLLARHGRIMVRLKLCFRCRYVISICHCECW